MDPLSLGFGNVVVLNSTATKIRHCSLSANVLIRSMANLHLFFFFKNLDFLLKCIGTTEMDMFLVDKKHEDTDERIDIYKKG